MAYNTFHALANRKRVFFTKLNMNKAKIIALLQDGAFFNRWEDKFFHPSFRKGWRKMKWSDISWAAAERALYGQLDDTDGIYKLKTN